MDWWLKFYFPPLAIELEEILTPFRFFSDFLILFRQLKQEQRIDNDETFTGTNSWTTIEKNAEETDEFDCSLEELGLDKFETDLEILLDLDQINYHTMIRCMNLKNLESAQQLNDNLLRVFPNNFIGLWNRVELSAAIKQSFGFTDTSRQRETLAKLKVISKDDKEMLIAKAGVAAMYALLGYQSNTLKKSTDQSSNALEKSIKLYDEVFEEVEKLSKMTVFNSTFQDLVASWKQDMALNYVQLINEGKKHIGQDSLLTKVERLLEPITTDERISGKIRADALIQLADASRDYKNRKSTSSRDWNQDNSTSIRWLEEARELDPDDDSILLRITRHMRRHAASVTDIKDVIERLKTCLEKGHQKSVVYHHLGLAYRSLWLQGFKGSFPPLPDHTHSFRNGLRCALEIGNRVIRPPIRLVHPTKIPRPYKKIPKKLLFIQSNHLSLHKDDPYLLEARKYFEEAVLYDGDLGCLMLIEVSRTYISTRDIKRARECFRTAVKRESIADNAVYLFEQMGLMEESQLEDKNKDNDCGVADDFDEYFERLEHVKSIYREAIRYDTRSSTRAVIALHRLLLILYIQTQTSRNNLLIQSEYFLIYMAIQQSENPYDIIKAMVKDEAIISLTWRLIVMFHRRNEKHDFSAVFTYLSILAVNDRLTTEAKSKDLSVQDKKRILLESAEKISLQDLFIARYLPQTYTWLCQLDDCDSTNHDEDVPEFAILVDKINIEDIETVRQIINEQLLIEKSATILVSTSTKIEDLLVELQKFQSIVIIPHETLNENHNNLICLANAITGVPEKNKSHVCQAVFSQVGTITPNISEWLINRAELSLAGIQHKICETASACKLLRALFKFSPSYSTDHQRLHNNIRNTIN